MRVLIDIGHPGHVHFYKNVIRDLENKGHTVLIAARSKDLTIPLLKQYGFRYTVLSSVQPGSVGLLREFVQREAGLLRLLKDYRPQVVSEIGGIFIAPVCWISRTPSVVFTDSEPVPLDKLFTYPFASVICTPDCFLTDLGQRQVRYAGYHELAYLHPDYFAPDPSVLDEIGCSENETYSVVRFVAWRATHDMGQSGFPSSFKRDLVGNLGQYGRVFVTSESPLTEDLEPYRLNLPPHRIHDLLHYAHLFMGDGATMATEAALLGTPAVRSSTLALSMGNFVELMDKYGLVYSYYDREEAVNKAIQLLQMPDAKAEWRKRREAVLSDKIDVAAFVGEMICASAAT